MATYLENLERWRNRGAADKRAGKPAGPPSPHYREVMEAYMAGYEEEPAPPNDYEVEQMHYRRAASLLEAALQEVHEGLGDERWNNSLTASIQAALRDARRRANRPTEVTG